MTTDREFQITNLRRIIDAASVSPVFRKNSKYSYDGVARIGYDDVMAEKCILRCDDNFPESGHYWRGGDAPVIAAYNSIEELVDDGWRLD